MLSVSQEEDYDSTAHKYRLGIDLRIILVGKKLYCINFYIKVQIPFKKTFFLFIFVEEEAQRKLLLRF